MSEKIDAMSAYETQVTVRRIRGRRCAERLLAAPASAFGRRN
ncbi:hypothetical protein [Streptomyces sp. WM6372]|nr:hypothetical protein [Streptomyces sp. WM6372]